MVSKVIKAACGPLLLAFAALTGGGAAQAAEGAGVGQGAALDAAALFTQGLVIFLREGAEAILIIAALWVVLTGMKAPGRAYRALIGGAGAGLAVSAVVGLALARWLAGAEEIAELVEGATLLLAAAVLLFVSSWLLGQREAQRWTEQLRERARRAFSERGIFALFVVGFLAVFREGAETVLFLLALAAGQQSVWLPLTAGGVVAAIILLAAFYAVRGFGLRLPLRAFFTITAWSLLALAVIYVGKGVHEMQEVGLITETALAGFPKVKALGIYPYVETLAAQALTLALGLFLNLRITQAKRAGAPAAE